jgi:uncharacterized phage infection (PIP) family protein YhgE
MISDMASATGEQSEGISQVSTAIGHLDQVTQQNAALVEQSTGAYESLKEQMTRLADAVGGATAEPWRTLQERPGFGLGGRPGWRSGRVSAQRR